jgi:hypothetical protein
MNFPLASLLLLTSSAFRTLELSAETLATCFGRRRHHQTCDRGSCDVSIGVAVVVVVVVEPTFSLSDHATVAAAVVLLPSGCRQQVGRLAELTELLMLLSFHTMELLLLWGRRWGTCSPVQTAIALACAFPCCRASAV